MFLILILQRQFDRKHLVSEKQNITFKCMTMAMTIAYSRKHVLGKEYVRYFIL